VSISEEEHEDRDALLFASLRLLRDGQTAAEAGALDPIMQFEGDPQASAQVRHAIENREGSYGGAGVAGGGCGCN